MPVIKDPSGPRGRWPKIGRDSVIFLVGVAGIINEAFIRSGDPRTELLILFASMCGLPAFLRLDESRNKDEDAK
jgi:hypothetical protein